MKKVYLFYAMRSYMNDKPICVFYGQDEVRNFLDKCTKYNENVPEKPNKNDSQDLKQNYWKELEEWEKNHPAKLINEDYLVFQGDEFSYTELSLVND